MATVQYIQVGKLQKAHGLKGELQASIDLYDPDILSEATVLFVEVKNAYAPYFVESIKINGSKAIILFDEIQKADPDVLFSLLQILEEGKITDTFGSVVDFSNSIIIMTTNVGAQVSNSQTIGFNSKNNNIKSDVLMELKKYFPADLLNRIDEIIIFNSLNDNHLKSIIKKQLDKLSDDLINRKIKLSYTDSVVDFLYNRIQLNNFGARQVDKTLQRELQTLIAEKIINDSKISELEICIQNNNICVI